MKIEPNTVKKAQKTPISIKRGQNMLKQRQVSGAASQDFLVFSGSD